MSGSDPGAAVSQDPNAAGPGPGAGRALVPEHVLDAARRGDEAGMAELWRALNPLILRYLRVVIGDAAEDAASETWLQAAREIRGFRGDAAGFRVWLFRVARNRALEELRRRGRRPEEPAGLTAAQDHASADDPAREAVERLATRRALRMIAQLPPNQAEAVMLRVVVGLDVAQTASVLGKRPGAVRVAAMRGLRQLAAVIEQDKEHRAWFTELEPEIAPRPDTEPVRSGNISTGDSGLDDKSDIARSDIALSDGARSGGVASDGALIGAQDAVPTGPREVTE